MIGFIGSLGWPEVIIILVVALLLFGGKKLPELAKGVAKGLKTFRGEMDNVKGHINEAIDSADTPPQQQQQNPQQQQQNPQQTASTDNDKKAPEDKNNPYS